MDEFKLDPIEDEAFWASEDALIDQDTKDKVLVAFKLAADQLTEKAPFLDAITQMPVAVTERTPAIATNGNVLWLNPNWWTTRSAEELCHCAGFIAFSLIYNSIERGRTIKNCDYWRWGVAVNLLINRHLIDLGVGTLPKESAFITSIDPLNTSEQVYEILQGMTRAEIVDAVWPLLGGERIYFDKEDIRDMLIEKITADPDQKEVD